MSRANKPGLECTLLRGKTLAVLALNLTARPGKCLKSSAPTIPNSRPDKTRPELPSSRLKASLRTKYYSLPTPTQYRLSICSTRKTRLSPSDTGRCVGLSRV